MNFKDLESLSLEQLREIATAVGVNFSVGNSNIHDKQDFLLVLDEADEHDLVKAYNDIVGRGGE